MSKKLVKTAKQQFEERLRELTVIKEFQLTESDIYYLCENEHREMSILRKIHDNEFYEYKYDTSYRELVESEEFLKEMADRFNEAELLIKPLFEWYASADKDNEPFTLDDIWMCDLEIDDLSVTFEDLYEEVPDVRIITAKEQWEKDTEGLTTVRNRDGNVLLVNITVSGVKFYDNYDGFACYSYPSLDEMRKDSFFVSRVVDELMRSANHNKIGDFMEWVREGGDFPLNPAVIYESEYQGFTFMKYEDKEESTEKPTVKNEFKEERDALREKMLEHIVELCDQGMSIDSESFLENATSVTWASGTYYDCANIRSVYLRESVDKGFEFSYECKYDAQGDSSDSCLSELSIETLACIIKAMQ